MFAKTIYGRVKCFDDDAISRQIKHFGNHTRPEFSFATSLLNLGDFIFDLGAHIGTFTFPARHKIGDSGKVLCIEGNPKTFEYLSYNIAQLRYKNVQAKNCLIGVGDEKFSYVVSKENTGASYVIHSAEGALPAVSLDSLVEEYFPPDFIKIDVEGYEFAVLGSSRHVSEKTPVIYMEVVPEALSRAGSSVDDLNSFLCDLDYRFYVNSSRRNWRSDLYRVKNIKSLLGRKFFDALCVKKGSEQDQMLDFVSK
jgi:FkbM family methyltransferase